MNKQLQYILLPTDKVSDIRLTPGGELIPIYSSAFGNYQYIYICSDDEIKEGDWVLCKDSYAPVKHGDANSGMIDYDEDWKKIIATTNPELHGSIDDAPFVGSTIVTGGLPSISQSDIEYICNLYNGKGKEMEWYPSAITSSGTDLGEEGKDWEWKQRIKKNQEVDVEKLADDYLNKIGETAEWVGFVDGYNKCLQDNADKKFTLEDIEKQISDFKHDLRESVSSDIKQNCEGAIFGLNRLKQSLTKEQPKNKNAVVVEYERDYEQAESIYPAKPQPKLKDGCIVIIRD